jgi:deoxyribonuclease-1
MHVMAMKKNPFYVIILAGVVLCPISACSDAASQRIADYETARKVFWHKLYADGGRTLYCQRKLGTHYNQGVNIEHVFPMSWVTYSLRCGKRWQCRERSSEFNRIEADLHNLYPARADVNEARNNYRFAIIAGEARPFKNCDFEYDERQRMAEPAPHARGKVARAMLYMRDEYELYLKPGLEKRLLEWDSEFPPDDAEYRRNDRIERIQGNRNTWIDHHRQN